MLISILINAYYTIMYRLGFVDRKFRKRLIDGSFGKKTLNQAKDLN